MEEEGSEHVLPGRGVCGRGIESIEGVSDEIDGDDQFDQSSRILTGDYFCLGFFFSEKGKVGGDFPSRKKKRARVKVLTGLVELVADMDFARFNANRLVGTYVASVAPLDASPALPLVSTRVPFNFFSSQKEKFFKGDWQRQNAGWEEMERDEMWWKMVPDTSGHD